GRRAREGSGPVLLRADRHGELRRQRGILRFAEREGGRHRGVCLAGGGVGGGGQGQGEVGGVAGEGDGLGGEALGEIGQGDRDLAVEGAAAGERALDLAAGAGRQLDAGA